MTATRRTKDERVVGENEAKKVDIKCDDYSVFDSTRDWCKLRVQSA